MQLGGCVNLNRGSLPHLPPSIDLDRLYELCRRCLSAYDDMSYKMSHYLLSIT
jgi:hypothetical protein